MRAVVVFLFIIAIGIGFVIFDTWIVSDQPTHVFHVTPTGKEVK